MNCKDGFEQSAASADLCINKNENPYVAKLVNFFHVMQSGFRRWNTFQTYGASEDFQINGKELLAVLNAETEQQ